MKKILILGALVGTFANATVTEQIINAFVASEAVQGATQDLKRQLRQTMPGCVPTVVAAVDGHLFAANVRRRNGENLNFTRTYLVSRGVFCTLDQPRGVRRIRRSVTAKVVVDVRERNNNTYIETPKRVVVVDISNDVDDENELSEI